MNYLYKILLLSFIFIGCDNTTTSNILDIESIKIENRDISIYSTDLKKPIEATVVYTDKTTADGSFSVIWESSNSDILSVSNNEIYPSIANGGDVNLSIKYAQFFDTTPVHVHKLISYDVIYPDINSTGSFIFEAKGEFDNNDTNITIKNNILWYVDNGATVETDEDGVTTITFLTGDTNVTTILFNDTNSSSQIAPKSKIFTIE